MTGRTPHQDFITSLQLGSFQTVRELYLLHYSPLYHFCNELLYDLQDANDIVTDTFIKLLQGRDRFDSVSNIKAFLYITARNTCLNYLKQRQHTNLLKQSQPVVMEETPAFAHADIPGTDVMACVRAAIDQLPDITRAVFIRMYCNREYVSDIACQLNISPAMIVQHKIRALHLLRQLIGEKEYPSTLLLIYYLGIIGREQQLVHAM